MTSNSESSLWAGRCLILCVSPLRVILSEAQAESKDPRCMRFFFASADKSAKSANQNDWIGLVSEFIDEYNPGSKFTRGSGPSIKMEVRNHFQYSLFLYYTAVL